MYWIGGRAVCACVGSVDVTRPLLRAPCARPPSSPEEERPGRRGDCTCPNPGGYTIPSSHIKKEKNFCVREKLMVGHCHGDAWCVLLSEVMMGEIHTRPCLDAICPIRPFGFAIGR